jgi:hypothetical protein
LKDYFDVLVATRSGTQKSYLLGPNKTVVSDGGLYTILYENHPERGYVGHRFIIKEIDGNRFKMEYGGLESTFSVASSAFGIGNEMYFRKDSFFHYWLARTEQDDLYHNYVNQERTFVFFGKIWPVASETNTYSIEFEGMKDFTLKGIPQHNQTVNMEEWLKVYWDQVHHEMYNMTKTFWSMNDAREIDIRWLAYIASIYGVEISEDILNELPLREWVDNLPSFLKRIGTYNALYVIWKVFMANTKNHLNVYERWGEWCVQNFDQSLGTVLDDFVDHHFLEFYGTQPSGGAGDYYYSRYDPTNYPTHALTAPSGDCITYKWNTGFGENYILFDTMNLNCSVNSISQDEIEVTEYDPTSTILKAIYLSGGSYTGDFLHSTGVEMDSSTTQPSNIVFWALSNEINKMTDHTGDYLSLSYEISGGQRFFKLIEQESGSHNSITTSGSYAADTPYYLIIDRTGSNLRLRIYNRERKWAGDLIETAILSLSSVDSYTILYALNGRNITGHNAWSGKIYGLSTSNIQYSQTLATSGAPVITPHYKVQVDLSTEPLGDVFGDNTIISEEVIDELIRNFEFARPVSKYSHYEELIAPLARIDRTGDSIALYPLSSNGHMDTSFTGSQFISAGGGGEGIDSTYAHYQQSFSKTWTVTHNLNSPYVLVQPWIFINTTPPGARVIMPNSIEILNNNSIQLVFNESVRGVAAIAASGAFGVTFIESDYVSSPSTTWSIDHNLNTNIPSTGYTNPPGPVVSNWDNDGYRIISDINELTTNDILSSTWSVSTSGGSIVRRSDYLHTQNSPSSSWSIEHKLNSWVIVQCYDIITDEEIFPDEITFTDFDNLEISWAENTRGYAHVIQVVNDSVIYSPYECDITGLGICPNVLGYWKVGTGTTTSWNPFVQNDLETPATSGVFKSIEEDSNNYYIDFIVPSDYDDIGITEVGLFNYLDQLVFYSKCSDLFKPEGVQCFFHYRVRKINSSSSSSSSVSSSSSSSTSLSSSSSSSSSSLITGIRGVFGGGYSVGISNVIDYITINTTANALDFGDLTVTRQSVRSTSNGTNERGVFNGGDDGSYSNVIDYITIDSTGNATDFGDLTGARASSSGTSNGTNERGVFGGGSTPFSSNVIDYITINSIGNATDFGDLTSSRVVGATSNSTNERGVFGGGSGSNVIDYITINSTGNATDFGDLTVSRGFVGGTSNNTNERGLFVGGNAGATRYDIIDYITINSTGNATDFGDLTVARNQLGATSDGTDERGVFGGGDTGSDVDIIDYVTINSTGNATDFGDLTIVRKSLGATSDA